MAAAEAALESGGSLSPADRRLLRVAAPIALQHGVEGVLVNVCRYAGRVRWAKCRGALVRQRFVDALDVRGLGDAAVPPAWQHLRRSEAVRVDRSGGTQDPPSSQQLQDVPEAPPARAEQRKPEKLGAVLTGNLRELLRQNGVELEQE